jgi:hypothetical protein
MDIVFVQEKQGKNSNKVVENPPQVELTAEQKSQLTQLF